jgi:NADPH-dependent 2,4-dienoyl-CoA reductase/sulfur reductase-like enzyme/nitrite reductase/ring-hydroxylating ferredoxin subunit
MKTTLQLTDLAEGTATKIMLGETAVLLIRDGNSVRAFGAKCPHAGAPLEGGAICNGRLICPWHKATFQIEDGALLEPPALDGLTRYPVSIDQDSVTISSRALPAPRPAKATHDRVAAIIGSGAAGAAAASALRFGGFDGQVLLIGNEAEQPYDRTALSKFVVAGEMKPEEVPPLREGNDWDGLDVRRLATTVSRLDAATRRITLADGSLLTYDTALLATGGIPKRPFLPGISLPGIYTLRSLPDAAAILAAAQFGQTLVIIGSSFIGLEVACGLRRRGIGVTVVSPEAIPFERQFGAEIGAQFRRIHEANGVTFCLETEVTALEGRDQVHRVVLKDGRRLETDGVIIGTGVTPATDFVEGVQKAEDGGIFVDAAMRAADRLFVAGDCARFPYQGQTVRIEHWRVAQQHARVAALGMMGVQARYEGVPFFWTYHYGKRIEYLGHAKKWDGLHIDGQLDAMDFIAFQVAQGRVAGIIACGRETATARLIDPMRAGLSLAEARAIASQ